MLSILFLKGLLVGLVIAAPLGPIDMLCIRKTLLAGMRAGFITGMGAAFADAIYAGMAVFGLAAMTDFLIGYHVALQVFGGIFLCVLGVRAFFVRSIFEPDMGSKGLVYSSLVAFVLALTSPMTIVSFVGAFAAMGIGQHEINWLSAMLLIIGVFLGSTSWWFILSSGVALFKNKIGFENYRLINDISGVVLLLCGIAVLGFTISMSLS